MGEIQARMQAKLNILQLKVNELHREIGEDTEVLAEWQTAYLVICGVFSLIYHTILLDHQQHSTCTHGILCQRPTVTINMLYSADAPIPCMFSFHLVL